MVYSQSPKHAHSSVQSLYIAFKKKKVSHTLLNAWSSESSPRSCICHVVMENTGARVHVGVRLEIARRPDLVRAQGKKTRVGEKHRHGKGNHRETVHCCTETQRGFPAY